MDLGVVRQGLHLFLEFGLQPLEEMVRVAELLEHSVYEKGSLTRRGNRVSFVLLNPPLRMGAFHQIALTFDGVPVPPDRATVEPGPRWAPRPLAGISRSSPVTLPVGTRTRFTFESDTNPTGTHRIRLDLHSLAIPPCVWFELSDRMTVQSTP